MMRRYYSKKWVVFFMLYILLFQFAFFLANWYPGDQTIRNLSESMFSIMISSGGISIGNFNILKPNVEPMPFISKNEVNQLKTSVVYSSPQTPPQWDVDIVIQPELHRPSLKNKCYFRIHEFEEQMMIHDGEENQIIIDFTSSQDQLSSIHLNCIHFIARTASSSLQSLPIQKDGSAGKVLFINSVTSLNILSKFHKSLLNHQSYSEYHQYGFTLSIISPSDILRGRSNKFGKHFTLAVHALEKDDWDTICHVDLDAWFSSWDPISRYTDLWPLNKELMFGDTGQIWINSGLICMRPSQWSVKFFEKVLNAKFRTISLNYETSSSTILPPPPLSSSSSLSTSSEMVNIGFYRDQPALWHILFTEWNRLGLIPYQGNECSEWLLCNPEVNPLQCWHWCFWESFHNISWWKKLTSINSLPHIYLVSQSIKPQFHNMCLRSCPSMLEQMFIRACSYVTLGIDSEALDLCDGLGCAKQMMSEKGTWLKHSGHKHWTRSLIATIPTNYQEARKEVLNILP